MPKYFSRHYYDLAMLADTADGQSAAGDVELLVQVARHKAVFFRSGWAHNDTARPGTLRLLPDQARVKDLRTDYRQMALTMFDKRPPAFDEMLARIEALENTINSATEV